MAVDYYLVNKTNQTLFELGRGYGATTVLDPHEVPKLELLLADDPNGDEQYISTYRFVDNPRLFQALRDSHRYQECSAEYVQRVTDKILAFGGGGVVYLVSDSQDTYFELKRNLRYKEVASAYENTPN
jgi:hypothetical protein